MRMNRVFSTPFSSSFFSCNGLVTFRLHNKVQNSLSRAGFCKAMNGGDRTTSQDDVPSPSSAIDFLTLCQRLKTTKRTGWIYREVKDPESIADHMYRMAAMALIAVDIPGIDRDRCVKMAIVHDIAEAIVGDIAPSDGISKEEKSQRERKALEEMCQMLGGGLRAKEIYDLWNEYENNSSPEAKIVKDFDKVEMILQALEYESGICYRLAQIKART
ncbi:uncharacterized protein LOC131063902 isoform X3 [Cryptomeria japonica]|uniref:uncharacterized protein LOC131063902 isoform X3 n=1 Tax=Cryptomeria japonica TaxID=3369 RepID=UPI0027D9F1BF|nr:uncharacterized protein LOC131063902 isoform X3 [Cryptomeria japonica]XP_059074209.1 uncharacterized protein LOC131063902 isoform X3 [Cryptomeria japonica]